MSKAAAKIALTLFAVRAILLSAAAAQFDIAESFQGADSLHIWSRDPMSRSRLVADEEGVYLKVIEESAPLSLALSAAGPLPLDDDVIFDARVKFTPAKRLEVPSLPADSKFALWQYVGDGATNFYVTAGGEPISNARCTPTNYRLGVVPSSLEGDAWRRVTVRAVKGIRSDMLGFVVFVDGHLAVCVDDDYGQKLPRLGELSPLAEYLVSRKALFPSLISNILKPACNTLELVAFAGVGAVDDLSVKDAPLPSAAFAEFGTIFELKWGRGITGFTLKTGDSSEGRFIDTAAFGEDRRLFVEIGDAATVTVTNIAYDASAGYHGPLGRVFAISPARATLKVEQSNYGVGGASFTTLAQAYAAVSADGEIRLLRDVNEAQADTISVAKPFTLDLAGRVLEINTNGRTLFFINSAGMSLVSSSPGGELVVGPSALSLFVFSTPLGDAVVPEATIGAHEGDDGVTVRGRLVEYTSCNLSIVGGAFTDSSAAAYAAADTFCSSVTNAAGFYVVPESSSLGAALSSALAKALADDMAGGCEGVVTMQAIPGLSYGVAYSPDLKGIAVAGPTEWVRAESDTVTVRLPRAESNCSSVFYRLLVRP